MKNVSVCPSSSQDVVKIKNVPITTSDKNIIAQEANKSQRSVKELKSQLIKGLEVIPDGWVLTPVGYKKNAYREDWQKEKPLTKDEIKKIINSDKYCYGYGLRNGEVSGGLLQTDLDGQSAIDLYDKLAKGDSSKTVEWVSGKPGRKKRVFRVPQKLWEGLKTKKIKTGVKDADGKEEQIELRWDGSQDVLPPSHHPETNGYKWVNSPEDTEVAECPAWILQIMYGDDDDVANLVQEAEARVKTIDDIKLPVDKPVPLVNCLAPITRDAIQEGKEIGRGRDDTCFVVASDLIGTKKFLEELGQDYEGDIDALYAEMVRNLPRFKGEDEFTENDAEKKWKSANKRDSKPSLDDYKIENIIKNWYHYEHLARGKKSKISTSRTDSSVSKKDTKALSSDDYSNEVRELAKGFYTPSELVEKKQAICKKFGEHPKNVDSLLEEYSKDLDREDSRDETKQELEGILSLKNNKLKLADFLPQILAKDLAKLAYWLGVPEEVFIIPLLPTAASLLNPRMRVIANTATDWKQPFIFFSGLVCDSGSKKSEIISKITKPLKSFQTEEDETYKAAIIEYEVELETWKQDCKEAKKQNDEIPPKPIEPQLREFYLKNTTGQALDQVRAKQTYAGFVLDKDELSGLINSYGAFQNGKGEDKESILTGFDGNGVKINRAGGKRTSSEFDAMSIVGGIQPDKLKELMGNLKDTQGEWARFLWLNYKETPVRLPDEGKPLSVSSALERIYRELTDFAKEFPEAQLSFNLEGQKIFNDYVYKLDLLKDREYRQGVRAAISKQKGYAARLAGILYLIDCAEDGDRPQEVIPTSFVTKGIELSKFFLGQTMLLYVNSGEATSQLSPKLLRIIDIASKEANGLVTGRNLQLALKIKSEEVLALLNELEALEYGKVIKKKRGYDFQLSLMLPNVTLMSPEKKHLESLYSKDLSLMYSNVTVASPFSSDSTNSIEKIEVDENNISSTSDGYIRNISLESLPSKGLSEVTSEKPLDTNSYISNDSPVAVNGKKPQNLTDNKSEASVKETRAVATLEKSQKEIDALPVPTPEQLTEGIEVWVKPTKHSKWERGTVDKRSNYPESEKPNWWLVTLEACETQRSITSWSLLRLYE